MSHSLSKLLGTPLIFGIFLLLMLYMPSCDRYHLDPDPEARPSFSIDTITFDTVFTSIGSATLSFKIYNHSKRTLLINSVSLAGGSSSYFRINLDGISSPEHKNVEIPPDDSLFVFVAVTVDPTNSNSPVVIRDSIVFNTRGDLQDVKLIAFGQDIHLIDADIIGTRTWVNDKPYLIYNSMAVDTGEVLTIEEGTRIFFHRNSSMIIWGSLRVNGTWENPVIFRNDRLEEFYDIISGQWGTIYIDPISRGNAINHAIIKNGIAGIQIGYPSDYQVPELELSNSVILNHSFAGIYAFGAELTCYNTIIANSAGPALALLRGGSYRFWHCTVSNNGVIGTGRTQPSVVLTNIFYNPEYDEASGNYIYVPRSGDLEEAQFVNSILYGSLVHEFQFVNNRSDLFNYTFDHCLLKIAEDSVNSSNQEHFIEIVTNKDAAFVNDSDRYHLDFRLDTLSPAKDIGDPAILSVHPGLELDPSGSSRNLDGKPDLGAFERKED